jgi:hypothetical protein
MSHARVLFGASVLLVCGSFGDPEPKPTHVTGVVLGPDLAPLPEYTLALYTTRPDQEKKDTPRTRVERVTTDADGRFTSALTYSPGPLRFERIDRDSTTLARSAGDLNHIALPIRIFDRDHDGKPVKLVVPCGPTFDLTWKPYVPKEGETSPGPAIGISVARLFVPNKIDDGWSYTTTPRAIDETHAWVRFGGSPVDPWGPNPERLVLEVVSGDGLWISSADVTELQRSKSRKVELAWKPCCTLVAVLEGVQPTPGERIWMYAERLDEKGVVLERRRKRVGIDRTALYTGLDEGTWRLSALSLRNSPWTGTPFELRHDTVPKIQVDLKPYEQRTSFHCFATGDPVVEGGREPRPGIAWISRDDGSDVPRGMIPLDEQPLVWTQKNGAWQADIEFKDVIPGAYLFAVVAPPSQDGPYLDRMSGPMNSVTGGPIPGVSWRWPEQSR